MDKAILTGRWSSMALHSNVAAVDSSPPTPVIPGMNTGVCMNTSLIKPSSVKLCASLAAMFGFPTNCNYCRQTAGDNGSAE
jgi:hypothetical protein